MASLLRTYIATTTLLPRRIKTLNKITIHINAVYLMCNKVYGVF